MLLPAFWILGIWTLGTFQKIGIHCTVQDIGDPGCPKGSYQNGSYCYRVSASSVTFSEADHTCKKDGGFLAIFNHPETKEFAQKLGVRTFYHRYWIGLREVKKENRWRWMDNKKLNYKDWAPHEPNNHDDQLHCANLWLERDLQWDDENCKTTLLFVCQYGLDGQKCATLPKFRESCFELSKEFLTFDDADRKCQLHGGHLVQIKNRETSDFLKFIIFANRQWMHWSTQQISNIINEHSSWKRYVWIGGANQNYPDITESMKKTNETEELSINMGVDIPHRISCPAAYQNTMLPTNCDKQISLICQYPVSQTTMSFQTASTMTSSISFIDLSNEGTTDNLSETNTSESSGPNLDLVSTSVNESLERREKQMDLISTTLSAEITEAGGKPLMVILIAIGIFLVVSTVAIVTIFIICKHRKKVPDEKLSLDAQSDPDHIKYLSEVKGSEMESVSSTNQSTEMDMDYIVYHAQLFEEERCDEHCGNGFVMHRTLL